MDASDYAVTRRQFVRWSATLAGVAALAGCRSGARTSPGAAPPGASSTDAVTTEFIEPPELRSRDGRLEVQLSAGRSPSNPGMLAYNRAAVGPTWRIHPGDTLTVDFVNELDESTNLHTHGLLVSPTGRGDDIFANVEPGGTRRYVYEIPADHPIGTFWYHPHVHGSVARQTAAGLVGAIVVEPPGPHPLVGTMPERLLVLNDPVPQDRPLSHMGQMHGRAGGSVLVNGQLRPTIEVAVGTREHWRIINASASRRLPLGIDGQEVVLVGLDGDLLAEPTAGRGVVLAPGERADLVVSASEPGPRNLLGDGFGSALAIVRGVESSTTTTTARVPAGRPQSLAPGPITRRRTLRFGSGGGMMGDIDFTIDGRTFDADRVDVATTIGSTEEWTIVNDTMLDHPFHLHVWPFLVEVVPLGSVWKDTVNVPAGSSVTITIPFDARPGRTVFHCHVLDHEDMGMMGVIDVT